MAGKSRKIKIFKNVREYFSQVGKVRNSIFSLSLSLRRDGGMGFPALARNGYETRHNSVTKIHETLQNMRTLTTATRLELKDLVAECFWQIGETQYGSHA